MSDSKTPPASGLHLPIDRRSLLRAGSLLAGAGVLGASRPLWAADTFEEMKPRWTSAKIDWRQQAGKTIVLGGEQHSWMKAITPLLPHFTRLTGIEVKVSLQSETEYVADMPVKLGAKNPTPDVFMVWSLGQAISARWIEPLDAMLANPKLTDSAWWDADDVFPSALSFQKWSDGHNYALAITAEAQTLYANKALLDAKGLKVPATMDEWLASAKALKTPTTAGVVLRARATGDAAAWPAGGFVFGYGGAIMTPAGQPVLTSPETVAAVEMYARLLREAGPLGVGNYHWQECLNDFMGGAAAFGCDSSNFATDIGDKNKSKVAGNVLYGAMPKAGNRTAKPNMWHWVVGMNSQSKNKDATWLFLQWATSKPTCELAAAAGLATPRASAWATSAFGQRFGTQAAQATLANLKAADGDLFKAAWFHPKSPQILEAFAIAVNQAVTGAKDAKSALEVANTAILKALA